MKFQALGESGYVNISERLRIGNEVEAMMRERISRSSLASSEIELCYMPILMPDEHLDRYPARSSFSRKENVMYCCPQLDFNRYKTGTAEDRRAVIFDGLRNAEALMRRAKFSEEQIAEYLEFLEDAKREAMEKAPKGFLLPRWLDVLRTLARR